MKEREFQTELIRGLRHHEFHAVPIPDSGGGSRFGTQRIYDLGIGKDGVYYGVELKRGGTSLPFDSLQSHQRQGLLECELAGHQALVICIFVHKGGLVKGREKVRRSKKTLEAWSVSSSRFLMAERALDRKSAPLSWWREFGIELMPFRAPAFTKDGEPSFDKRTGKRNWVWAWDFRTVHRQTMSERMAA